MTSTLPPLVQAFTGAIGSAAANALTYPADLSTSRLQLQPHTKQKSKTGIRGGVRILQSIANKYGVSALYDGLVTDTGATLLSNFFYFYVYSFLRDIVYKRQPTTASSSKSPTLQKLTIIEELFLGFLAGVASRAVSTPLSLITLRLQTETQESDDETSEEGQFSTKRTGVVDVIQRIYKEDGLVGFWKGFQTTALLCLNPSLTLSLFQFYRRILALSRRRRSGGTIVDPTPGEAFIGGAISSSIAVAILYPLILAKTRLQAYRKRSSSTPATLLTVLEDAYKSGGEGLYQGLEMQILKGFVNQGMTFLVKGRIEQMVVSEYLRRRARGL